MHLSIFLLSKRTETRLFLTIIIKFDRLVQDRHPSHSDDVIDADVESK
ncbi:MAG: hypothetical protein AB4368_00600 [Xenococcaceae cyanobacterium]